MKLYCSITDDYLNCKEYTSMIRRSFALKIHFVKRHKLDLIQLLSDLNFEMLPCAFCGEYNIQTTLITEINDGEIKLLDVDYTQLGKKDKLHYCYSNKNCPGKKLNHNSIEFISKTRQVSEEEARKILHSRNKSPFYRCNHTSEDEYKKYQGRKKEWFEENNLDYDAILAKRIYNGSLKRYQLEYGDEIGYKIYKQKHKDKAITMENLTRKYGAERATEIYKNWLTDCKFSLENYIRKFGSISGRLKYIESLSKQSKTNVIVKDRQTFIDYLLFQITRDSTYVLHDYPLEKKILDLLLSKPALEVFKLNIGEVCKLLKDIDPLIQSFDNSEFHHSRKRFGFGIITYTDQEEMLRSKEELSFYIKMKKAKLTEVKYQIDGNYPNSNQRFDFAFPDANIYIEVSPLCYRNAEYTEKIEKKKKKFNCHVLINQRDQDEMIEKLKEFYYGRY